MKLVIEGLGFAFGKAYGYQEYLFNLLDYFYEHRLNIKYDSIIIVCDRREAGHFEKYSDKFEIVGFDFNSYLGRFLAVSSISSKLSLKENDLILFPGNFSSLKKHCKQIVVVHDLLYLRKAYFAKTLYNFLFRLQRHIYIPRSLELANSIISISEFTKQDILSHFKIESDKINVIYNYFDFKKYTNGDDTFSLEYPYYLSICSSAYHKNTISLLKAFKESCSKTNNHLVIIGSLDNRSSEFYNQLVEETKNRVHIMKQISNPQLAKLYINATAYISASLFEGLGMPVVEAMYFNTPVLLSDIPPHREVSLNCGYYFEPSSYGKLAEFMSNPEKLVVHENVRERIIKQYSESNTSNKYIDLINAI